jgi:hypothetical protein
MATTIKVKDKTYTLARLDRGIADDFTAWADTVLPSPFSFMKDALHHLPDEESRKLVIAEAMKQARVRRHFLDAEVQALLGRREGERKLAYLLLHPHHPELTEEEAAKVLEDYAEEHGFDALKKALQGDMPKTRMSRVQAERQLLKKNT